MLNELNHLNSNQLWLKPFSDVVAQAASEEGCELYDIEVTGSGKARTICIYLDKADGITLDDCSNVTKRLNAILDDSDIVPGEAYNLEVSSPGIERHLKTLKHFQSVVGKKIWLQLSQNLGTLGIQNKAYVLGKKFDSILQVVDGSHLVFHFGEEIAKVPLIIVEKAHVVFELPETNVKLQKNKKK